MRNSESIVDGALDAARRELDPSSEDRTRVRAALGARLLALGAIAGGLADGAAQGTQTASVAGETLGWLAKLKATGVSGLMAAGVLVGAGAGTGYVAGKASTPAVVVSVPLVASPVPVAQKHVEDAPEMVAPELPALTPPAAKVEAKPARPALEAAPAPSTNKFEEEITLLRRAERALRANNPQLTLALLGELDQRIPRGALLEERAAARVLAGCQVNGERGRAVAERFIRERPSSVYTARIRAMCGTSQTESRSADTNLPEGDTR